MQSVGRFDQSVTNMVEWEGVELPMVEVLTKWLLTFSAWKNLKGRNPVVKWEAWAPYCGGSNQIVTNFFSLEAFEG